MAPESLIADLGAVVGADRVRSHPLELMVYATDAGETAGEALAVVFPRSVREVAGVLAVARCHGVPVVPRGSGTGLAGGAVPARPSVVLVTSLMDRILEVSPADRAAWVEAGVLNLDLTRHVAPWGLQFAPDPSSRSASTVGGNVITNAGGPHCLAEGSTAAHVLAVEFVTSEGEALVAGGPAPDPAGLDIRGLLIGSEGTLGIVTRTLVRLTQVPPAVRTLSLAFPTLESAAAATAAIIAAGLVPAALELMDQGQVALVEEFTHGGLPDATQLIAEVAGHPAAVAAEAQLIEGIAHIHGVAEVRVAASEEERELLWQGRRASIATIGRAAPDHRDHDVAVPRDRLVEVVGEIREIAARHHLQVLISLHAGDGNLHPCLTFDGSNPEVWAEVDAASHEIAAAAVRLGGVISGEHGIGMEKKELMPLLFDLVGLRILLGVRRAFDPGRVLNPGKGLPLAVEGS